MIRIKITAPFSRSYTRAFTLYSICYRLKQFNATKQFGELHDLCSKIIVINLPGVNFNL